MSLPAASARLNPSLSRPRFRGLFAVLVEADRQWRSARRLQDLDPHLCRDIGLEHTTHRASAPRGEWDVPRWWR